MSGRYRRSRQRTSRRPFKTVRYSNETANFNVKVETDSGVTPVTVGMPVIAGVSVQGMRKAKNFRLSFLPATSALMPIQWALVYKPANVAMGQISTGDESTIVSMYEPNQNVIMSGILPPSGTSPIVYRTRLARNLNSGDEIGLVFKHLMTPSTNIITDLAIQLNYAITF